MKKFVTIFLTLISLIFIMSECSIKSIYQKKVEELIISSLKSPSSYKFIKFEAIKEEKLREQIEERIEYFSSDVHIGSYYDQVNMYHGFLEEIKADRDLRSLVPSYEKDYIEAQEKLNKELAKIDYLKKQLEQDAIILDKIVAKEFKLTFEATNPMGVMIRSSVKCRFNENDEIVAIQEDDDDWTLLGNYFSIPGYYDIL